MTPAPRESSSTLSRALDILGMFSTAVPLVAVEDIMAHMGYTRSTAYRYIKELSDAGLVAPASAGSYSLGPRIVELERLMELTDPLYRAGRKVLEGQHCENNALLLHNVYDDKVLCIYKVGPDVLQQGNQHMTIRRARGIPFSLFQGAASLAMLPYLSAHRIRQTYLRSAAAIQAAGLGASWDEFRRKMAAIRRVGYATSRGQITPFVMGVGVPILLPEDKRLIGSLARACPAAAMPEEREAECAAELRVLAARIADEYAVAAHR
ncbi:IclR family transcriptional regulator [Candidimonas nitroreducens]|nr:helix-turn-helix domain-containing protein [Candidimonas nitroreducens]